MGKANAEVGKRKKCQIGSIGEEEEGGRVKTKGRRWERGRIIGEWEEAFFTMSTFFYVFPFQLMSNMSIISLSLT